VSAYAPARATRALEYWLMTYRRTWRGSLLSSVLTPVLFLGAMGAGLGGYVKGGTGVVEGVRYSVYLAPGLLAAWSMQTAVGEATWPVLGAIKWQKAYLAMLATPLTIRDVLLGHLGFMSLRLVMVCTSFTVVTLAFGLVQSALGALLALLAAVLTGIAFAAPIAAFSATQEQDTGFSVLYRLGMIPLFLFSGTFFPITQLPAAIRWLAYLSPLWHGVAVCRDFWLARGTTLGIALHLAVLLGLVIAGTAAADRTFRRRLER
jgi:lipooligosaccharide transport system permease protein